MLKEVLIAGLAALSVAAGPGLAQDRPVLGHDVYGTGADKVIVLHDWMGDATNYDVARAWLDPDRFSYAFADVRGYGRSREITGVYTSDEIAQDVERLADALGWETYHLIGHSMNGMAGFKAILRDWTSARRIKSYVAVTPVTPDGYPASEDDKAFLQAAMSNDETAIAAFGALTGGKLNATWAKVKTARNRASSTPEALNGYYDMWLGEDFASELAQARVGTPVLVIGGRQDLPGFLEAYYNDTLKRWLPAVSFAFIENAGHYPMHETPVLFATLIEGHIEAHKAD